MKGATNLLVKVFDRPAKKEMTRNWGMSISCFVNVTGEKEVCSRV
jgi:hypothetical protein